MSQVTVCSDPAGQESPILGEVILGLYARSEMGLTTGAALTIAAEATNRAKRTRGEKGSSF